MAVESLLLTAKVGHSSEDFVRRGAFSGVSKFLCDKIFAGDPQVLWNSCNHFEPLAKAITVVAPVPLRNVENGTEVSSFLVFSK